MAFVVNDRILFRQRNRPTKLLLCERLQLCSNHVNSSFAASYRISCWMRRLDRVRHYILWVSSSSRIRHKSSVRKDQCKPVSFHKNLNLFLVGCLFDEFNKHMKRPCLFRCWSWPLYFDAQVFVFLRAIHICPASLCERLDGICHIVPSRAVWPALVRRCIVDLGILHDASPIIEIERIL